MSKDFERVVTSTMCSAAAMCFILGLFLGDDPGSARGTAAGVGAGISIVVTLVVDHLVRKTRA